MTTATDYREFVASKRAYAKPSGFEVAAGDLNPHLKPFQSDAVRYLLRIGRGAAFEECGLGKSLQQLEWAYQVARRTGGLVLILTPLAVAQQTIRECEKFNVNRSGSKDAMPIVVAESDDDVLFLNGMVVTNYEKLPKFNASRFAGVVLDESSLLKSFNGKTKQRLCEAFSKTPYKLACTATPSPNDQMELGNHAEFLSVMPSSEMLARWFINDTAHVGKYRLKHHAREDYWRWVASWAICLSRPSDLGYSDEGYVLPPLELHEHEVDVEDDAPANGRLFRDDGVSATSIHREKRASLVARADKTAELVNAQQPNESWIVWCDTDYEADALVDRIPDAVEVRGSMTELRKRERIEQFSTGRARVIITKPEICGFGLNWQHCSHVAFVGVSYSFERFYQAVRRTYRFGQTRPVHVHVVNSPVEQVVWRMVKSKEAAHLDMQSQMAVAMRDVQQELVRGVRRLRKYDAQHAMSLPAFLRS